MGRILDLLELTPSSESSDYVRHKGQFHLHGLLTEQRHPGTWDLGDVVRSDTAAGLASILSVDRDIVRRLEELASDPAPLEQAVRAVTDCVRAGRRIYVYGCGATGRLAKQMESTFWRPFWRKVQAHACWETLSEHLPQDVAELMVGEMTGADRALVSSLEGFEDLMLVGKLQLADHAIRRGDLVWCVTEGGETSSVIGTILAALDAYGELDEARCREARQRLFFVYNNPDEVLRPFERSARVLDSPGITRIRLATGPQAIAGSTRMQATTIETFVLGAILEEAVGRLLREHLNREDLEALGFARDSGLSDRLRSFQGILDALGDAVEQLALFTELESATYRGGGFSTYFARAASITVFIDGTERSPTFRLHPLDRVNDPERRCWVQVWTDGEDAASAWRNFLGRPFRGLDPDFYGGPLAAEVDDLWLRKAALTSLENAGNDQEQAYDFSFSQANAARRGPGAGDLGVAVLVDEEIEEIEREGSAFRRFVELHRRRGLRTATIHVTDADGTEAVDAGEDPFVKVCLPGDEDPLGLRRQIALKILLNAHSTAAMARLGRVVGNTMTSVSPSNLKLVGRATFLILSHVNDVLDRGAWAESLEPIAYEEANAVLMDAMTWVRSREIGQTAEVALSIIRILEALRRDAPLSWEEARAILEAEGLAGFLRRCIG